jgi:hypothetical protein
MPSRRILLASELPPRRKSEVAEPIWPLCTTVAPGIRRSTLVRSLRSSRSSGPRTLVASLVCGCGVGVPVAVTTIDWRTHSGSSTRLCSDESNLPT